MRALWPSDRWQPLGCRRAFVETDSQVHTIMNAEFDYQGILSGDILALQGLFRWILGKIRTQFGPQLDSSSDQVAIDTMEKVLEVLEKEKKLEAPVRGDDVFRGYVFKIAKNCALEHLRKLERQLRRHPEVSFDGALENALAGQTVSDGIVEDHLRDMVRRVLAAIKRLPDKLRVFILAWMKFKVQNPAGTLEEFATTRKLSAGNAATIKHRAVRMLRDILSEGGEP